MEVICFPARDREREREGKRAAAACELYCVIYVKKNSCLTNLQGLQDLCADMFVSFCVNIFEEETK